MAIVRWEPAGELASMEIDRLNRMFTDFYGEAFSRSAWVPAVDIYETDAHEVVLKAELPEMKREDISVTVRERRPDAQGRAQVRAGDEEGELSPRRTPPRHVLAFVHAAEHGGRLAHQRGLQGWDPDHQAAAARRGEAEADRRQYRVIAAVDGVPDHRGGQGPGAFPALFSCTASAAVPARTAPNLRISCNLLYCMAQNAHIKETGDDRCGSARRSHHEPLPVRRRRGTTCQAVASRRLAAARARGEQPRTSSNAWRWKK